MLFTQVSYDPPQDPYLPFQNALDSSIFLPRAAITPSDDVKDSILCSPLIYRIKRLRFHRFAQCNGAIPMGWNYRSFVPPSSLWGFPSSSRCVHPTLVLGDFLILQTLQPLPTPVLVPSPFKVPQEVYGNRRRQWNFERSDPISFSVNGRPGINMRDALRRHFTGLDGRDDAVLQNAAGAISCRILV